MKSARHTNTNFLYNDSFPRKSIKLDLGSMQSRVYISLMRNKIKLTSVFSVGLF
jgi:hypothetical protein